MEEGEIIEARETLAAYYKDTEFFAFETLGWCWCWGWEGEGEGEGEEY